MKSFSALPVTDAVRCLAVRRRHRGAFLRFDAASARALERFLDPRMWFTSDFVMAVLPISQMRYVPIIYKRSR
jgi:hypothetical protein